MTCEEFRRALDEREPREPSLTEAQREHAERCPACAFALRLEAELVAAPSWAGVTRMSLESRARVLAKAKVSRIFFGQRAARLVEDSAFSAVITMVIAGALVYVLPGLLKRLVPPGALDALKPYLAPFLQLVSDFTSIFAPLANQAWGVGLITATLFMLVFAAILSAKALVPRWQT
jgi:hypothetical protein